MISRDLEHDIETVHGPPKAVNSLIPNTARVVQQAFDGTGGRDLRCRHIGFEEVAVDEVKVAIIS